MITVAQFNFFQHKLKSPIKIKDQLIEEKSGYLLHLSDSKKNVGVGELSPLAGLSSKDLPELKKEIGQVLKKIIDIPFNLEELDFKKPYFNLFQIENRNPNILFCIESAILSLLEAAHPEMLKKFFKVSDFNISVPLNGLFINEDLEKTMMGVEKEGLNDLKIKVGRNSINEELKLIWKIYRQTGGKINLRLDANQKFDLEDYAFFSKNLPPKVIEYIEDPVKEIELIGPELKTPIALDETLPKYKNFDSPLITTWVIKPSIIGGLSKAIELIDEGAKRDIKVVISSAFESNLSLRYLALLAHYQNQNTTTACGLDTFRHFLSDESGKKPLVFKGNIHF
jgi:o-succinylbenzoate synthase